MDNKYYASILEITQPISVETINVGNSRMVSGVILSDSHPIEYVDNLNRISAVNGRSYVLLSFTRLDEEGWKAAKKCKYLTFDSYGDAK